MVYPYVSFFLYTSQQQALDPDIISSLARLWLVAIVIGLLVMMWPILTKGKRERK